MLSSSVSASAATMRMSSLRGVAVTDAEAEVVVVVVAAVAVAAVIALPGSRKAADNVKVEERVEELSPTRMISPAFERFLRL